jgi:PadR family transcriptional regulator AphA
VSLRHALLGLLAVRPASGYQLTQQFAGPLGHYAWQAGHTRIYPELAKLADDGLASLIAEGARGSRTYDITDAGREELRRWLLAAPERGVVRNEMVLRMFLLSALPAADAGELLRRIAAHCAAEAAQLRATVRTDYASEPGPLAFGLLAAEFGLRQYQATEDWAHWALEQLEQRGTLVGSPA